MTATISDQAARLRSMVREAVPSRTFNHNTDPATQPAAQAPKLVAIASGKGGVGKTLLAVGIARTLAFLNHRVTLIDADHGTANADLMLGLNPSARLGTSIIEPIQVPDCPKLKLIAGAVGAIDAKTQHNAVRSALRDLGRSTDVFVVDLGAGISPSILAVMRVAWLPILVTTPEPTACADAYALYKSLVRAGGTRAGLIVNQCTGEHEGRAIFDRFATTADRFVGRRPARLGTLPADPKVRETIRARKPIVQGPFATSVASLARRCSSAIEKDRYAEAPKKSVQFRSTQVAE